MVLFGLSAAVGRPREAAEARASAQQVSGAPTGALRQGRELLQTKHFLEARQVFRTYLQTHRADVQAELGLGDAELGLRQFEAAEATYRTVVAQQPELWQAHKNLVIVEAALGRWEEFDRERTVLRLARERGAPGISPHESDVIDRFDVSGEHWVVRAYFEPLGRSQALYNFERFSEKGRVEAFLSLEDAAAAQVALTPKDVRVGPALPRPEAESGSTLALNWYTPAAHGTVRVYPVGELRGKQGGEPSYERVRVDALRWLRSRPAAMRMGER